jgi:mycothiol synthase
VPIDRDLPPVLPSGLRARPTELVEAPLLRALMAAQGQSSIGDDDATLEDVTSMLTDARMSLPHDTLSVFDEQHDPPTLVAWGALLDAHDERGYLEIYVQPGTAEAEFAQLVGFLADHCLSRAANLAASRGRVDVEVHAGTFREEQLTTILPTLGFAHERVYWRMSIELADPHDYEQAPPDGVSIRSLDPHDPADLALAASLVNDVMREHHGHLDFTVESFRRRWFDGPGFDPTAWWLARAEGEPAAILLADDSRAEYGDGFVRTLGVTAAARGRGIARALLLMSFAEYARRGRQRVVLAVDAQNATGATQLYESVGMRPVATIDAWSMVVPASAGAAAT